MPLPGASASLGTASARWQRLSTLPYAYQRFVLAGAAVLGVLACALAALSAMSPPERDTRLERFERGLVGGLEEQLRLLRMALSADSVDVANVIALPLLLGVGVDNGIHRVHRMRSAPRHRQPAGDEHRPSSHRQRPYNHLQLRKPGVLPASGHREHGARVEHRSRHYLAVDIGADARDVGKLTSDVCNSLM